MSNSQDLYVNTSVRQVKRPESPLLTNYRGAEPVGTYIARSGVVTADPNYVPPT